MLQAAPRPIAALGILAVLLIGGQAAPAQAPRHGFLDRLLPGDGQRDAHRYVVFVPAGEPPSTGWPVVLFLHGAGERGTDSRKQVAIGLGPAVRRRAETFPAVVVFPQADFAEGPILETWRAVEPAGRLAMATLADVERDFPIDPQRRTVTGWSMGGYGALALAAAHPQHWSRILALSGGGETEWAPALARRPLWMVHGVDDAVVPVAESRAMAAAISSLDHQMTLSDVRSAGHNLWHWVYDNDQVLNWMIAPLPAEPPVTALSAPAVTEPSPSQTGEQVPFVPALLISRAISLRLGNAALQTLAEGLPEAIGESALSGTMDRIEDQVEFDDREFDVRFEELTYQGHLHRAILGGRGAERLNLSFAVRDFEVTIGRIEVSDSRDSVVAEPVTVIIGHREPVWLDCDVRPVPSCDGGLQLDLLRSDFRIPDHNWYVQAPETIDIRGELFTEEIVRTALVGGVYLRRATIEEQILAAVPDILDEIEQRVDFSPLASLITTLWPLPVYSPQVQMRLEETSADRNGVSLVFECAVAALDGSSCSPAGVPQVSGSSPAASDVPATTDLEAAVSLEVIEHLSGMVAGSDAVRLYAADIPGRPFQELDDVPSVLAAIGTHERLSAVQDVRTQFFLTEPFSIRPIANDPGSVKVNAPSGESSVRLAVEVPRLSMTVFRRSLIGNDEQHGHTSPVADMEWLPTGERELSILQPIQLTTTSTSETGSKLRIYWDSNAAVLPQSEGADTPDTLTDQCPGLVALFQQGWARWAANQTEHEIPLPDVEVGPATLRLDQLFWRSDCLTAAFSPPPTILVNRTERPVSYTVRGPHSRWSREFTIPPKSEHVYRIGYPLHVRPGGSPSPTGQLLTIGTYEWSAAADESGFHWVRGLARTRPDASETRAASAITPR